MGRLRRSRVHKAQRDVHRATRTRARTRDIDLIQLHDLDPKNRAKLESQPIDVDRPGLGQHYCVECAKYMETDAALKTHWKSKVHKRRVKVLKEPVYTIEEAERAGGLGRETRKPKTGDVAQPS
ncbi:Bud site selection protein 20 [Tulasnella sp. 419]|nr:Bud site selection protein 20 [Tulasnella sp. 419]